MPSSMRCTASEVKLEMFGNRFCRSWTVHSWPCQRTLGQADAFISWLRHLESERGRELHLVKHESRFNDLESWVFDGKSLHHLHPFFALRRPGFIAKVRPTALRLIPEDALQLYDALSQRSEHLEDLAPEILRSRMFSLVRPVYGMRE